MNIKSLCLIGALVLVGCLSTANAAVITADASDPVSVLYSNSAWVGGSATTLTTLNVPGAGEVFLTLTDLSDSTAFTSLGFSLTNSPTALVGLADPGTLQLTLSGPTTLYADVVAATPSPSDDGLYNLTATFVDGPTLDGSTSPVPLPGSGVLLGAGLMALLLGLSGRPLVHLARRLGVRAAVHPSQIVQATVITAVV